MSGLCCWNCGAALAELSLPLSRRADCPACRAELHCCRMCRHYDTTSPDQCREERAEPPTRKEVANFCEWFTLAASLGGARSAQQGGRRELDALFGASSQTPEEGAQGEPSAPSSAPAPDAARRALDDLFD